MSTVVLLRCVASALVAVIVCSLAGTLPAAADPTPAPVRILIVGDSITQGSAGDWTWRYRLWQHLQADGVSVDFVGPRDDLRDNVSGADGNQDYLDPAFDRDHAAHWGMTFFEQDFPIGQLVSTYHPDVVVELLGVNDLFLGATATDVDGELRRFVADARAADPAVDVVASRVPDTWFANVPAYNALVSATATELDTRAARVVTASPDTGYAQAADTWDSTHPDAEGEVKIAAAMADALSRTGVGSAYPRPLPVLPVGPRVPATLTAQEQDGAAQLAWSAPPGVTAEYVWTRDVTQGEAWRRLPYPLQPPAWTAGGLTNGHRYAFLLQPVKGDHAAADDVRSNVVLVVPHAKTAFPLAAATSVYGTARLTWSGALGATSYVVEVRDVTTGTARRPVTVTGSRSAVTGLLNGHRYAFHVGARFASDTVFSQRAVAAVPALSGVTRVRGSSLSRDRVVVTGRRVAGALSYRAYVAPARSCAVAPAAWRFRQIRSGLPDPRFGYRTTATRLWVRLRAVRAGVVGPVVRGSSACVRVR